MVRAPRHLSALKAAREGMSRKTGCVLPTPNHTSTSTPQQAYSRERATRAQGLSRQGAAWSYWFLGSSAENGVTTEELSNSQKVAHSCKVYALKTPPWGLRQILQCLILETNSTINLPQGLSLLCLHSVLPPACTDRKDHRKTYWEITSKNRKTAVQAHASLWNWTSTLLK